MDEREEGGWTLELVPPPPQSEEDRDHEAPTVLKEADEDSVADD